MKKIIVFLLAACTAMTLLSGCDSITNSPSCEHTYEWQKSEETHQKIYTCGCPSPDIAEVHSDVDGDNECDLCKYILKQTISASEGLKLVQNDAGTSCAVISIGSCKDKSIIIPAEYEGLPVVGILPEAFKGNNEITSIVIPDSVVLIYQYAFMDCTSLVSVEMGTGLKGIFEGAFAGCTKLEQISLPDGLEKIYEHAFNGCASLEEVVLPDSITEVGKWAFANCSSLVAIEFSDKMQVIEESTCYACTSLTSIDFGDGVTYVETDAFYGCISLERLYIPKNIQRLISSFTGCGALSYVEFEITSGWKWRSKNGAFFNTHNVTNPETNAYDMKWTWDGSSWSRE